MPPKSRTTSRTAAAHAAGSVTSQAVARAAAPAPEGSRSSATTVAPAFASARHTPRPMFPPPPVTIATCPYIGGSGPVGVVASDDRGVGAPAHPADRQIAGLAVPSEHDPLRPDRLEHPRRPVPDLRAAPRRSARLPQRAARVLCALALRGRLGRPPRLRDVQLHDGPEPRAGDQTDPDDDHHGSALAHA